MTRTLPREEWHRLPQETQDFLHTMNPEDVAVKVVEEGGEIVARMTVMRVPHWESFWMAPERLGNAGVTRALLIAAREQARQWAPYWFYANADSDATMKTMERLGGVWMAMHTYLVPFQRLDMEEAACPAASRP